ncbi:MAG TPA: ATPase, T2SS/T4P/T4SS family [Patescibacteria group bacterium]|nr:ATPase, T2SS/T4P/T4SS family [Patescibacteria group bacterium]
MEEKSPQQPQQTEAPRVEESTPENETAPQEPAWSQGDGEGAKPQDGQAATEEKKEEKVDIAPKVKAIKTNFSAFETSGSTIAPEIIDQLISDALEHRASDVHIEPQPKIVEVRFRIDGVLYEVGKIPKQNYENILNRIKVQAHLRVDEHFSAQDGSLRHELASNTIDIRVSIIPTIEGEKIVLRMLAIYVPNLSLSDLGILENDQQKLLKASKKPFGMILAVGPTGSGKTTTLYALLKNFNIAEINLTTIEDPVEYKIAGANQIQVNLQTNLTFAKGLRSIVRQDPDIILVGEIRDKETAEISVNAALTGHLLFSTFHANDAAASIPRLLDMGIEPFLLASTLEAIAAQRLVRKICEKCKYKKTTTAADIDQILPGASRFFSAKSFTSYAGKGCPACAGKGYQGRTAIYEIVSITPEIEDLILKNPSSQAISQLARKQGFRSLFEDGMEKVTKGITTPQELLRVASPPEIEHSLVSHKAENPGVKEKSQ